MFTSFWESDALLRADSIVIGAGLIGLQTALALKEQRPRESVLVLDASVTPSGASTRNAGFACFGSLTEILSDFALMGREASLALLAQRWHGLQRLRERLGDEAIRYESLGGHELLRTSQLGALEHLDEVNALLSETIGDDVFVVNEHPGRFGFGQDVAAVLHNRFEGQLHSGHLLSALRNKVQEAGIGLLNGAEVSGLRDGLPEESGEFNGRDAVRLRLRTGENLSALRVAVCTNARIAELLPELPIRPARGQIILTEPVEDLRWQGAYHLDEGYWYFRNLGHRILLGGGRHLDVAGETSHEAQVTPKIQEALRQTLDGIVHPRRRLVIERRWAGVMGFTPTKQSLVQRVSARVAVGFGCNGMGVALSPIVAQQTAACLLEGVAPTPH